METKSLALGAAGTLLLGGLAFGLVSTANAENQPAPAPSTVAVVETVAPSPEPVVSTPAPEPSTAAPAPVEVAPVAPVVEPVAPAPVVVEPAPVYVAPEPVQPAPAPVYVAPAPAPQETYIATNTDAKVAVDANGYVLGGSAPKTGGDGPAKVDMPSK